MQKLLGIHKEDTESLTDYITRVNSATNDLIALAPSTLTFQNIFDEIEIHAAITGLDHIEYGAFTSSILLLGILDHNTIATAFCNEDPKCQASSASSAAALSTAQGKERKILTCAICKRQGHTADQCWTAHPELWPACKGERSERGRDVNQAKECASNNVTQELTGNASLQSTLPSLVGSDAEPCWNTDTGHKPYDTALALVTKL